MKILLVEDDPSLRELICKALNANNFSVDTADNGESGYKMLFESIYDLIILDIMLPLMSGIEILKKARENNNITPVIFLTAKDGVNDRIAGLDAGADDYLVKPFSIGELLARIRALLRRPYLIKNNNMLEISGLMLDMDNYELRFMGEVMKLPIKEANILRLLIKNANKFIQKDVFLNTIWSFYGDVGINNVEVYISRLRKYDLIRKSGVRIETRWGVGYRIVGVPGV